MLIWVLRRAARYDFMVCGVWLDGASPARKVVKQMRQECEVHSAWGSSRARIEAMIPELGWGWLRGPEGGKRQQKDHQPGGCRLMKCT